MPRTGKGNESLKTSLKLWGRRYCRTISRAMLCFTLLPCDFWPSCINVYALSGQAHGMFSLYFQIRWDLDALICTGLVCAFPATSFSLSYHFCILSFSELSYISHRF